MAKNNQVDVMKDISMLDVWYFKGADSDTDCYLVIGKTEGEAVDK
jgi:hypothetical protein